MRASLAVRLAIHGRRPAVRSGPDGEAADYYSAVRAAVMGLLAACNGWTLPGANPLPPVRLSQFPRKSLFWLIKEKIPLLVICAASALVTMKAQRVGRPQHWPYSMSIRVGNSDRCLCPLYRQGLLALAPCHHVSPPRFLAEILAGGRGGIGVAGNHRSGHRGPALSLSARWLVLVPGDPGADHRSNAGWTGRRWLTATPTSRFSACSFSSAGARRIGPGKSSGPRLCCPPSPSQSCWCWPSSLIARLAYWGDNLTLWSHAAQVTKDNWVAEDMVAGILLTTRTSR